MKRSLKAFFTLVIALVVYQFIAAWIWHRVGFMWSFNHHRIPGYALYAVEGVLLPVLIGKIICREGNWWRRGTMLVLSCVYFVNFQVEDYVWMIVSGYQATVHDWGEGWGNLIAFVQWIITSVVLWLFTYIWGQETSKIRDVIFLILLVLAVVGIMTIAISS